MLTVIEQLLSPDAVAQVRARLDVADWEDGLATAGGSARRVKQNQQLPEDSEQSRALSALVAHTVQAHPLFISAALPRTVYPPRFNRYADGGSYGTHVDSALMRIVGAGITMRTDLSATLFLSQPDEYDGGELEIETPSGAQTVKLAAGDMVLYQANSLHRVTPVTRGVRTAAFFWVESLVPDNDAREMLFDLDQTIQRLTVQVGEVSPDLVRLTGLYHNLLRRWAAT